MEKKVVAETEIEMEKKETPKKKAKPRFQIGYIGQEVKALQKELGLPETGIYDVATDKAAR